MKMINVRCQDATADGPTMFHGQPAKWKKHKDSGGDISLASGIYGGT